MAEFEAAAEWLRLKLAFGAGLVAAGGGVALSLRVLGADSLAVGGVAGLGLGLVAVLAVYVLLR